MLGTRFIGRYKVIEEIGRGGMGIVYRGEDPRLERPVAIKVLPPRKTSSSKALDRFKREARVCARLDHPYILKIYDYGEEEQTYHIVMEYVEGVTLRDLIGEDVDPAAVDVPEMARLFGQICQALEYAHALQITHRDIKPENIMVTPGTPGAAGHNKVKVMDFGLAVLGDQHSLTVQGAVMGTIAYFSPEQAKGERADHRSDLYSLGAMFHEMLTGQLPFEASNAAEMIKRHLETPAPSPRLVNASVHPILERIVLTCMRKDPADRYQNARAILQDLEAWRVAARISPEQYWGSLGMISGEARAAAQGVPVGSEESQEPQEARPGETDRPEIETLDRRRQDMGPDARERPGFGARDGEAAGAVSRRESRPPDGEMRRWRESDAEGEGEPAPGASWGTGSADGGGAPLTVNPLASPFTPGMPPELASRLGPARPFNPGAAPLSIARQPAATPPPQVEPVLPLDTVAEEPASPPPTAEPTRRAENFPAAGGTPVASKEWMDEAREPAQWGRYEQVMQRLRRDEAYGDTGGLLPSTVCGSCGSENPGDRKYCHDCGGLLAPSHFQVAREAAAHNDMGLRLMRQGQLQEAMFEFQQALLREPKLAQAHKNLGKVWIQLGDPVKGEEELRLATTLDPVDADAYVELAALYRSLSRRADAMSALSDALRIRPDDTTVRCQLAFLYSHSGTFVRAVEEYRTVLAYDRDNLEAHLQLGIIYGSQNSVVEATTEFEAVVRLDPGNLRAWQWLGQLYTRRNRFSEAERAYQSALSLDPTDADVYAELGSLYEIQRREDMALKQLRQAITLDQGHVEAHTRLAALYLKYNQPAMAIQQLEEVVAFHPQDPTLHQQLGDLYLAQNQLDRALDHFQRTVDLDPTSADMHKRLGQLYLKKDYTALSIAEFQKAVGLDPYNAGSHEDLGMAYYCSGQRDGAIQELKKAAILDARNPDYNKALGVMCEQEGRLEEAVSYLKRALEVSPRDADAHGLLGRVYGRQGMLNWAVLEFQKALEYNPDNQLMYIYLARSNAEMGRLDVAVNYFKQAIGLMGGRGETPEARRALARSYQDLARTYLEVGDARAARDVMDSALALNREDSRGLHYMALVLQAQGDLGHALEYMTSALQREPQSVDILADLAALYEQRGERELARKALRKALALNPNRAHLYELMSGIVAGEGQFDEADRLLRKALSLDPKRAPQVHFLQGNHLMEQGRWQNAAGCYQQSVAGDPWNWRPYQGLARAFEEMGRFEEATIELQKALSMKLSEADARRLQQDLERLRAIRPG